MATGSPGFDYGAPRPAADHMPVSHGQRFTRRNPCPICGGGDDDKRSRGIRCAGFLSEDGCFAFCTREEFAGGLPARNTSSPPTYKHRLDGPCHCGVTHDAPVPRATIYDIHEHAARLSRSHWNRTPERIHTYYTTEGQPYLRVLRTGTGKEKTFCQQRPDGKGDWYDGLDGLTPILYNLPGLALDFWAPIFIAEGEKACDALIERGQLATCNLGGAGKWRNTPERHEALRGRQVIILADNDEPGRAHAAEVAADLAGVAASVRILELPGLAEKGDVYDWLADGHTVDELRRLAAAAPIITACKPQSQNTNPARQDDTPMENGKTCPNCERLQERVRIAETSLAALRQEQAWARQIMALPKEQLSPAVKPAALAVYSLLKQPRERDEQGMEPVYRAQIARACGISDQTAGQHLRDLDKAGVIRRTVIKRFDSSEIRIGEGPCFQKLTDIPIPDQPAGWGGKRIRTCPACGGDNIEVRHVCRDCGTVMKVADLNTASPEAPEDEPPSDDMTDNTLTSESTSAQNPCPARQDDTPKKEADEPHDTQQDHPLPHRRILNDLAPYRVDDRSVTMTHPHPQRQPHSADSPPTDPCPSCAKRLWAHRRDGRTGWVCRRCQREEAL